MNPDFPDFARSSRRRFTPRTPIVHVESAITVAITNTTCVSGGGGEANSRQLRFPSTQEGGAAANLSTKEAERHESQFVTSPRCCARFSG